MQILNRYSQQRNKLMTPAPGGRVQLATQHGSGWGRGTRAGVAQRRSRRWHGCAALGPGVGRALAAALGVDCASNGDLES
jgi:hypothetical protein